MERSIQDILRDQAAWDVWKEMPSDSKEKYQAYLCSREWALLRNAVMDRCKNICERCHANKADAVHHLHYVNRYREDLEDLRAICKGCHEYTHGKSDVDPLMLKAAGRKQIPLHECVRLNVSNVSYEYSDMLCPVCGFDYVHFETDVTKGSSVLSIPMYCESGHRWDVVFRFHKGNMVAACENMGIKEEYKDA